jgi:hypothetical protein
MTNFFGIVTKMGLKGMAYNPLQGNFRAFSEDISISPLLNSKD